jgi:photosystem II stability/assembly factor-like uncharacterized protein
MTGYLLPLLLLAVSAAYAQPRYDKVFSVEDSSAYASAIRQTSDGGFIIAGKLTEYDSSISSPQSRGLLLRVDAEGNTLWYRSYGSLPANALVSVHQTADGGFLACGVTNRLAATHGGYENHWLLRTSANGDSLWSREYGSSGSDDVLSGMLQLPGGDYLLYGSMGGSNYRGYLARIDSTGAIRWAQEYTKPAIIYAVTPTRDGGFAAVGGSTLLRVDSVGKRLRDTSYTSRFARIYQIIETAEGGYALAGDDDNGFSIQLAGVDTTGRWLWSGFFNAPRIGLGSVTFRATRDRGYIVVGYEPIGGYKRFVLKTDIVGKELWSRLYDTLVFSRETMFNAVEITPESDLVLAGYHFLDYQKVTPGSLPVSRIDSEGYLVRPAPDRFWKRLHYTGGEAIASMTIDSVGTILVGEYANTGRALLYRSTDDGHTWQDNNGPGYQYKSMVTAPGGDILAIREPDWQSKVPDGTGGWRSTDRGVTWTRIESFPSGPMKRLECSRSGDLYAMGYNALHRSSDNGAHWDSLVVPDAELVDIAIAPDGTVYITTDSLGILRSTDRGGRWSSIIPRRNNTPITGLGKIDIRRNGDLFATKGNGVDAFHSPDDGATWYLLDSTVSFQPAALAFDRYGAIYVNTAPQSTNPGIWRSTDDGATWTRLGDTALNIRHMMIDRKGRLLGAGIGIFQTEEAVASVEAGSNRSAESLSLTALPNPFPDETTLHYRLPLRSDVVITIVDAIGREVARLADDEQEAGEYRVQWNSDGYVDGVHYCVLRAGTEVRVEPLVLMR